MPKLISTLIAVVLASPLAAAGDPVDALYVRGHDVRLGGVRLEAAGADTILFPLMRGLVAIYNDGRVVRVHDSVGKEGLVERTYELGDGRLGLVRDVTYAIGDGLRLIGTRDVGSGDEVPLAARANEPRLLIGPAGTHQTVASRHELTYAGREDVTIDGTVHSCLRHEILVLGSDALLGTWVDARGVVVFEATAQSQGKPWRPRLILTGEATIPVVLLEPEGRADGLLLHEYLARRVLAQVPQTFKLPSAGVDEVPEVTAAEIDPARMPTATDTPGRVRVRRIVVAAGEQANGRGRSLEAAAERAERLCRLARARGVDFAEVARFYSDDMSARNGGDAGIHEGAVEAGTRARWLAEALDLGLGQVSDPIRDDAGYVIVHVAAPEDLAARRIFIAHSEGISRPLPQGQRRTLAEAQALAKAIHRELESGKDFRTLARARSEGVEAELGGMLGTLSPGQVPPEAEAALGALEVGGITPPITDPLGVAIYQRVAPCFWRATLIVVAVAKAPGGGGRTKAEAYERAVELKGRLAAPGCDARALAVAESDARDVETTGGSTGLIDCARLGAEFAPFVELAVGECFGPLERPDGYVIGIRTP